MHATHIVTSAEIWSDKSRVFLLQKFAAAKFHWSETKVKISLLVSGVWCVAAYINTT